MAEVDDEVAGTVSGGHASAGEGAVMTSMWVDPRFRRHGIGDVLVKTVIEWAAASGYREMYLWVTAVNYNAERLYLRNGFARTGSQQDIRGGLEFEMVLKL